MFHIFRWRHDRHDQERSRQDRLVHFQYKKQHLRVGRARVLQGLRSRHSFLRFRKYWASNDSDEYQVIITSLCLQRKFYHT